MLKYLLFLGIIIPGCPPFFQGDMETPALESQVEIQRLTATSEFDLIDCRQMNLEFQIKTQITGVADLNVHLQHDAILYHSSGTRSILEKVSDTRFIAENIAPGLYFFDYTIRLSDDFRIAALRGATIESRETLRVENPEKRVPVQFEVQNASCPNCADGSIRVIGSNLFILSPHWSTGDTSTYLDSLLPGHYQATFDLPGLQTCALERTLEVTVNAPVIMEESHRLTQCDSSIAMANYPLHCDSIGMSGQKDGIIDFNLGKVQFAELSLDAFIRLEIELANRGPDDWKTIYRLASSSQVLSEGQLNLPKNELGFDHIAFELPLRDFVLASGFDIDLSLRVFMRDSFFIRSLAWSIFEPPSDSLQIHGTGPNVPIIPLCDLDSIDLGAYYQVSGGSTPYQYSWDLNSDSIYGDLEGHQVKVHIDSPGLFHPSLEVTDATGRSARLERSFNVRSGQSYNLRAVINNLATEDTVVHLCIDDKPLILLPEPPSSHIQGSGISNNLFRPNEAGVGTHTLSVGQAAPCSEVAYLHVVVHPGFNSAWDFPDSLFCNDTLDLTQLIKGDSGGLWFINQKLIDTPQIPLREYRNDTLKLSYGFGFGHCAQYLSQAVFVDCIPTISKAPAQVFMSIYPNPAHQSINIQHHNFESNSLIIIRDTKGQIVHSEKIFSRKKITIDVQGMSPGIYFLSTEKNGQIHQAEKLIIHY